MGYLYVIALTNDSIISPFYF
jgi:hypothetical protein